MPLSLVLLACADPPADEAPLPFGGGCDTPGIVCTWLGEAGVADFGDAPAPREDTRTYFVTDLTFAADGTAYYPDFNNHRIRRVDANGLVTTVSGTGRLGDGPADAIDGCWGGCDLSGSLWNHPTDVAIDPNDADLLWVAAWQQGRVTVLDVAASTMTWWAGGGELPFVDGPRDRASFVMPVAVAAARDGALYVSDPGSQTVRKIDPAGDVTTIAGEPMAPGYDGDGGPAIDAHLHGGWYVGSKLALTPDDRALVLADTANGLVRRLYLDTGWIERVAGTYRSAGQATSVDPQTGALVTYDVGAITGYAGDGGDALEAVFDHPSDVAVGANGEIFVADTGNHCVREILPDGSIVRFAGRCGTSGADGDGGPALDATFDSPLGVAVGPDGAVYVADTNNHTIRRIARR